MQKIVSVLSLRMGDRGRDLAAAALHVCSELGLDLGATRLGVVHTNLRGTAPCIVIVQELAMTATAIEHLAHEIGLGCFHVQGGPTTGKVWRYDGVVPDALYASGKHPRTGGYLEFNGKIIHVQD